MMIDCFSRYKKLARNFFVLQTFFLPDEDVVSHLLDLSPAFHKSLSS